MHDLHIGDFCSDTARILLTLYKRFPQKSTLYIEDICGPDAADEFGLHSPRYMACLSAAIWLGEEAYLRYGQLVRDEALDEVVLTHKAFVFLSSASDTVGQPKTRISVLEDVHAEKDSIKLNSYMLELMRQI